MKIWLPGLILALVTGNSFAQKPPVKFGEIPIEDLKMVHYDPDSAASAVVLVDYGESSLPYNSSEGFNLNFERLTRIKILTKEGLDWATFTIPLYHDGGNNEKVTGLKAATYNLENGKIETTKLKTDAIFKEKVSENWDNMKVTLPNVHAGSVIEITYKVNSDFLVNFQDWEFQYTIPTRWSEYRANIPEFYYYDKYMQGYIPLAINEKKEVPNSITITSKERTGIKITTTEFSTDKIDFKESKFRWAAQNVPAFKPEPFITTSQDYISKINFELAYQKFPDMPIKFYMGSWEDINKQFSESPHFGGEVAGNNFLKKIVEDVIAGATTNDEKIARLNVYLKQKVEWDGLSRRFTDNPLKKVLEDKKGNSAELNLLLASMLEKAGFSVYPVLVSTRDHGFVREATPVSTQFNYVLCLVKYDDKEVLLDATDRLLPTGVVPERCLNGRGLVISGSSGVSWVDLKSPFKSRAFYNTNLTLDPDGALKGTIQVDRSGYYAQSKRKSYLSSGEDEYVKALIAGRSWTVEKSEFINAKDVSEPFKETHDVVIDNHVTTAGDLMYINPFLFLKAEQNPFKLEKREYPVDFGSATENLLISRITIPDEYVVDEMPKSQMLRLPDNAARYTYSIVQTGNVLTLTSNLQINNSLFSQDEYPHLREFYNVIVAKQAELIVLKKK